MRMVMPLCLAATLLVAPATAEESEVRDGFGLIQEGTRLMLRGLMDEIEPGLRDLQERIGDLSAYHAPEVLPNGDILIRRKEPLRPGEEIEL